jgi:hypothetical protein
MAVSTWCHLGPLLAFLGRNSVSSMFVAERCFGPIPLIEMSQRRCYWGMSPCPPSTVVLVNSPLSEPEVIAV